ncbi:MAG: hypothetical protein WBF04_24135 [Candidatus Sulfotelmatobacter sp.]
MFETGDQQRAETQRQEKAEADRAHSWVNFIRGGALTNEQLAALREASARVGRPLTDDERAFVLHGKVLPKVLSGIKII